MSTTFYKLAREVMDLNDKAPSTRRGELDALAVLAPLHDVDVAAIDSPMLYDALKAAQDRGAVTIALRALKLTSRVLEFAIMRRLRTAANCTGEMARFLKRPAARPHSAILDDATLGDALRKLDALSAELTVKTAIRMLPHVFTRPSELRQMQWSELDLAQRLWIIPADRMKMKREHIVPLSTQVIELLGEVGMEDETFVFPGRKLAPIGDYTLNAAMLRAGIPSSTCVPHGWRATASTWLNENGFDAGVVELQLAHVKGDRIAGRYDRSQKLEERISMMQAWSDHLDAVKGAGK